LQPDHVPSKHTLHGRRSNNCVALRPDVFETLVSSEIFRNMFQQTHICVQLH